MKELFTLFYTFAKIGLFTFGGGYAMLPLFQRELVDKHKWITEEELLDYFAIAQCTPGVIAVNTATFVGHKKRGVIGGIFATLGVVFPSIVIITLIAMLVRGFAEIELVAHALAGIRVAVCALILSSVIKIGQKSLKNYLSWIIFGVVFLLASFTAVPTAVIVIAVGILGLLLSLGSVKGGAK